ncbi:MAG: hypothetical protein KYX68_13690, partial [Flavobacterium sp.]|nr:hypothetical protein [Flavobacterium sp.]
MKNNFIKVLFLLISFFSFSQNVKIFMVELADRNFAPKFKLVNNYYVYDGKDKSKIAFFNNHQILDFYQSFPDSQRNRTLNVFTFVTYTSDFGTQLLQSFPNEFLSYNDVSDFVVELANTYPNDYGSTSPVTNLGTSQEISSLDYINVPKAWDYGYGDSDILIGMSDSIILETDNDFVNKITFLPSYTYQSMTFSASNGI